MKPPAFAYYRPNTLTEALNILQSVPDAKILAGGQSLIPMMNMRLAHPVALIDINHLNKLTYIEDHGDYLEVGARVRHYELEQNPLIQAFCPIIPQAERLIAHPAIRSLGTIGGSLSHADPAAELPVLARLLDWEIVATSQDGPRAIPAHEFFLSYFITALLPNEILTAIKIPKASSRQTHIVEYTIRHGDFALAIAAASLELDESGYIAQIRIALGGVADIPWRNSDREFRYIGEKPGEDLWFQIAQDVAREIEPAGDLHASAEYRRQLAETLLVEALQKAHAS